MRQTIEAGGFKRLKRDGGRSDQINWPPNPKHYWRWRCHLSLEDLDRSEGHEGLGVKEKRARSRSGQKETEGKV